MSELTVAQIQSEVASIMGKRTDLNTRIRIWMQLAQELLTSRRIFEELKFTSLICNVGTAACAGSTDVVVGTTTLWNTVPTFIKANAAIKFVTTSLTGTGTPDTWYEIASAGSDIGIVLDANGPDTSGAVTFVIRQHCVFDGVKTYHLENDFGLMRLRGIYSIKVIDGSSSKRLEFIPQERKDDRSPRPESYSEGRPSEYTRQSRYQIELDSIPDATYPLEFRWAAFPTPIGDLATSDTLDLVNKDWLMICATCYIGYMALQENEDAIEWKRQMLAAYETARFADDNSPDEVPEMENFSDVFTGAGVVGYEPHLDPWLMG